MKKSTRVFSMILAVAMIFSCISMSASAVTSDTSSFSEQVHSTDPRDYPVDSRERFVASMALQYGITYEEADLLEREESYQLLRASDEVLKYKTIDKVVKTFTNNSGYSESVRIGTEVRYVFSRITNKVVNLERVGAPIIYIPGASDYTIKNNDFNIEQHPTSARVSITTVLEYYTDDISVTGGIQYCSVTVTSKGYKVTSNGAITFILNINANDMN